MSLLPKYRVLECGIVIRINADGTSDWPYGPRSGSVNGVELLAEADVAMYLAQKLCAWQVFEDLAPVLARASPDLYDVTYAAIGYAALTYDAARGASMKTHALRMVRFAIQSSQQTKRAEPEQLAEHQGAENFIGQIEANVDIYRYKALLSREQWQLLLARYDSGLSLDDIAREFGYRSRTTAMNKIEQALSVCRRLSP